MLSPYKTLPAAFLLIIGMIGFTVIQSDRSNFQSTYDKDYRSVSTVQVFD